MFKKYKKTLDIFLYNGIIICVMIKGVKILEDHNDTEEVIRLVEKIKSGDKTAFGILAGKYKPLLNRMGDKYYGLIAAQDRGSDEEDFRQEATIALYNAAVSYRNGVTDNIKKNADGEVTFGLYAKICIRNRLISVLRKMSGKYSDAAADMADDISEIELGPEDKYIEEEKYVELLGRIKKGLTEYEKSVFGLYAQGYAYSAIAAILKRSEKSVGNAIYRIKTKLKKCI